MLPVQRSAKVHGQKLGEGAEDDLLSGLSEAGQPDPEGLRAAHSFTTLFLDFEELRYALRG